MKKFKYKTLETLINVHLVSWLQVLPKLLIW